MLGVILSLLNNKKVSIPLAILGLILTLYAGFSFWLSVYTQNIKDQCQASIQIKEQSRQVEAFKDRERFRHENNSKDHDTLVNELRSRGELRD